MDGRTDRRTDGRTDGRKKGMKYGRMEGKHKVPSDKTGRDLKKHIKIEVLKQIDNKKRL